MLDHDAIHTLPPFTLRDEEGPRPYEVDRVARALEKSFELVVEVVLVMEAEETGRAPATRAALGSVDVVDVKATGELAKP